MNFSHQPKCDQVGVVTFGLTPSQQKTIEEWAKTKMPEQVEVQSVYSEQMLRVYANGVHKEVSVRVTGRDVENANICISIKNAQQVATRLLEICDAIGAE